jgi:hypothetical protein
VGKGMQIWAEERTRFSIKHKAFIKQLHEAATVWCSNTMSLTCPAAKAEQSPTNSCAYQHCNYVLILSNPCSCGACPCSRVSSTSTRWRLSALAASGPCCTTWDRSVLAACCPHLLQPCLEVPSFMNFVLLVMGALVCSGLGVRKV